MYLNTLPLTRQEYDLLTQIATHKLLVDLRRKNKEKIK